MNTKISVDFFIDGVEDPIPRMMSFVPRVGEYIDLEIGDRCGFFEILDLTWNGSGVSIACNLAERPK
jgi:hypothetical protein